MIREHQRGVMVCWTLVLALALTCGCQSSPTQSSPTLSSGGAAQGLFGRVKHVASSIPGAKSLANRFAKDRPLNSSAPEVPAPELTEQNYAAVQVALGRGMERDGNLRGAKDAYEAAVRNDTNSSESLHRLALVKEKLGDGDSAESLLLQAAKLSPRDPEICCDLGYWYALREKWPEAQRFYEQAIELKPDFPRAHNNLGLMLARRGNSEAGLRHFSSAGLTPAEARTNLGFAHMSQQQWQSAHDQLQIALERDPGLKKATVLATALENVSDVAEPVVTTTSQATELVTALENEPDVAEPVVTSASNRSVESTVRFTR